MKKFLFACLIVTAIPVLAVAKGIPLNFLAVFRKSKLELKYEVAPFIKPAFLLGDFNGDGSVDIAMLVMEKKSRKRGILLIHGRTNQYFLFGAGTTYGYGSDDFNWMQSWKTDKSKVIYESVLDKNGDIMTSRTIRLKRIHIEVWSLEDGEPNAGGAIYWARNNYKWVHMGE